MNNYNLGYADGISNAVSHTGLTYSIGHKHSNSCYTLVPAVTHQAYCGSYNYTYTEDGGWRDGSPVHYYHFKCSGCGNEVRQYDNSTNPPPHQKTVTDVPAHNELICTLDEKDVLRVIKSSDINDEKTINDYLSADEQVIKIEIEILP